ncbi:MAG: YbhB/YbcL family Raf kinase inhibitor-like protein [Planctomycetes bacterium]|nr:YbhB/YbcL family Raf kinase inhibitor-like protein [Planctomycetota bacterium]
MTKLLVTAAAAALCLAGPGGCKQKAGGPAGGRAGPAKRTPAGTKTLTLRSSAFQPGGAIPRRYTGDGADVSPALNWSNTPAGTKELALVCDDPDAPRREPWVHWVIYGIPPDVGGLPEGVKPVADPPAPRGCKQGKNTWGSLGYRGPAPPRGGAHHYRFRLYALDAPLGLAAGADKKRLLAAMAGHVLATAELVGTYQR